ncbi:MAG: glucosylglycerate hydrolase [Propionicimonas sp.]
MNTRQEALIGEAAREVLRTNDTGTLIKAAPLLYPHQWSWDAAFVSIGLATFDIPRALAELEHLRQAQWSSGMIPHIVFSDTPGYFPDVTRWATTSQSPPGVATSGICQPAVQGIALRRIRQRAAGGRHERTVLDYLRRTFDSWLAWHRWLHDVRGADGSGLLTIHHGWESGMDNSPRFDAAYARVVPGELAPFVRTDTAKVADAGQRPSDLEYARYLWLVQQLADVGYRDAEIAETCDFAVKDVFASAIYAVACDDLAALAGELGRDTDARALRGWAAAATRAVDATIDPATGLARDIDVRAGEAISVPCISGFAPLVSTRDAGVRRRQEAVLAGADWLGAPGLAYRVPCSTASPSPEFRPRQYWRGPNWPVLTWFLAFQARRYGSRELFESLRSESLAQLADLQFGEYYEPFTAEPLGSRRQSWTAAVALEWVAEELAD